MRLKHYAIRYGKTAAALLLLHCFAFSAADGREQENTVTISGAWAVYPTAVAWAKEFARKNPHIRVNVSAGGAGKGATDAIVGFADIGMVSREPDPAELSKGIYPVYILHDAVFLVVNEKNGMRDVLARKGLRKNALSDMFITGRRTAWDDAAGGTVNKKIHVYTRSDSCGAAASWAAYFGKRQEDLGGIGVYGDPGMLEAVRRDPSGVGYSNFSYVFSRNGRPVPGIMVVPIDADESGAIDQGERCDSRDAAVAAIEAERYPVTRKNYFFVKGKPRGAVKEFIAYALSDEGTAIVEKTGASLPIPRPERMRILKELEQ